MEIWKDVEGYDKKYQVSNLGNVKSFNKAGEIIRKKSINFAGYEVVPLYKNKKYKSVFVHRMVAKAFVRNPKNKPFVNHLNSNRADNRVENLEWCTSEENMRHASKQGRLDRDNPNYENQIRYSNTYYKKYYEKNKEKIQAKRLERLKVRYGPVKP